MRTLTLIPKTRKGHNKLQNKVNKWKVLDISKNFANPPKDRILIEEIREDAIMPSVRWISIPVDLDFDIKEIT